MPADYVMMGCQFEGTGDSHIKLSQLNLGADFDGPWYGEGPDEYKVTAPQIQLSFEGREGIANYCYFVHDAIPLDDSGENFGPGWVDADGEPVDLDEIIIPAGRGCWFRPSPNYPKTLMTVQFAK